MIPGAAGGGEGEVGFPECENSSVPRSGSGFGKDEAVEEEQEEDIPGGHAVVLPNAAGNVFEKTSGRLGVVRMNYYPPGQERFNGL